MHTSNSIYDIYVCMICTYSHAFAWCMHARICVLHACMHTRTNMHGWQVVCIELSAKENQINIQRNQQLGMEDQVSKVLVVCLRREVGGRERERERETLSE